ncbi:MAG: tetratricopeptide repeat protein [Flavobacteriales bacterium]
MDTLEMISNNPHYINGRKKFEAQQFLAALELFNKAIEEEENPSIYSERGVVWYYLNEKERSLADMDHAASLEPSNPYRYSSRAYIKDWIGDIKGAIADYEKAVELDPNDSIAYNNLGLLQEKQGYVDKAKKNYERADKLSGVDELLVKIRKEQKELYDMDKKRGQETASDREKLSVWALLRSTLTTKSGIKEYLDFIKNGFRIK